MPTQTIRESRDATDLILNAIQEVKAMLTNLDERVRALEQASVAQSVTAAQRIDAAFRRLDEHTSQIEWIKTEIVAKVADRTRITDGLDDRLGRAETITNLVKWLGGAFGALIVALLWAILTHRVELIFK